MEQEIIYEFRTIGAYTQVRAIDVATGHEVAVTVPTSATKTTMIQSAKNKLLYVLKQTALR